MTWNYRIIRYKGSGHYGLHEVYYDDAGKPVSMTERAVGFTADAGDSPDDIAVMQIGRTHV